MINSEKLFGETLPPRKYPGKNPDNRAMAHHQDLFLQPFGFQWARQVRVAEHKRRIALEREVDRRWSLLVAFRLYVCRHKQLLAGAHKRMLVCYCCELRMACCPRGCTCQADYCLGCLRCVDHCECQIRKDGVHVDDAAGLVSFRVNPDRRGHYYSADKEQGERAYGKVGRRERDREPVTHDQSPMAEDDQSAMLQDDPPQESPPAEQGRALPETALPVEQYLILIDCRDEAEQVRLLHLLQQQGVTCRALLS